MLLSELGTNFIFSNQIKESLCVLVRLGFVMFEKKEKAPMVYSFDAEKVLLILRYPR